VTVTTRCTTVKTATATRRVAGERRERLHLAGLGDLDRPAVSSELIAHPGRAAHHLDAAANVRPETGDQPGKAVRVGGDRPSVSSPPSLSAHHAARREPQSMPRSCTSSSSRRSGRSKRRVFGAGMTDRRRGPAVLHDSRFAPGRGMPTSRISERSSGKMPTTSVRRPISWLKRSSGLVLLSFGQCAAGKA
jgi:hypothetical protein